MNQGLKTAPSVDSDIRSLNLSGNPLQLAANTFASLTPLGSLVLSRCQLASNETLADDVFESLVNLYELDLSTNQITKLPVGLFRNLHNLVILKLDNNPLASIVPGSFKGLINVPTLALTDMQLTTLVSGVFGSMTSLRHLDISQSGIRTLEVGLFHGLMALRSLDISKNEIELDPQKADLFVNLSLTFLRSDDYTFCCFAQLLDGEDECLPEKDLFSSCEDLLSETIQRVFLWVMGWVALLGNSFVFVWWTLKGEKRVSSYLVKYLSIADLLMGIYLIGIASVDTYYRNEYIKYATSWKNSAWCATLGVLASVSSEASVFTLLAITVDRLISIMWPFSSLKITLSRAQFLLVLIWVLATATAVAPLIPFSYFDGKYYSRSGVCMSLHITEEATPGWEYSVAIFHGLNLLSFMLIFVAYSTMRHKISQGMLNKKKEKTVTQRMMLIVLTDFCCWVPINVMGRHWYKAKDWLAH